jgi:hypothetical protein
MAVWLCALSSLRSSVASREVWPGMAAWQSDDVVYELEFEWCIGMIQRVLRSQANRLNAVFTLSNLSLFFFLSQLIVLLSGTFKYNKLYFYLFIWEEFLHTYKNKYKPYP